MENLKKTKYDVDKIIEKLLSVKRYQITTNNLLSTKNLQKLQI